MSNGMISATAKVEEEQEDGTFVTLVESTVRVRAGILQEAQRIAIESATAANVYARKCVNGHKFWHYEG